MNRFKRVMSHISGDRKAKEIARWNSAPATSPIHSNGPTRNFRLIWLDSTIDGTHHDDSNNTIGKLRALTSIVETFTNVDECVSHIITLSERNVQMIISGSLGQALIAVIHDIPQINAFYIFCQNKERHMGWASQWPRIIGVFTDIAILCETIQKTVDVGADQNTIPFSVIEPAGRRMDVDLDHLDRSFMYTQILKEILLTLDFGPQHIQGYFTYCRTNVSDADAIRPEDVEKVEAQYRSDEAIRFYTRECFLYVDLNCALRQMDVNMIIRIGFFLRDLHEQIAALHLKQYGSYQDSDASLTLYRGQQWSHTDFDQIKNNLGGLLAFNSFLSTSTEREVALQFAQKDPQTPDRESILFIMKVALSTSSTPFADVQGVSEHPTEGEILFSMHSTFRIERISRASTPGKPFWEVHLTLTDDSDEQLRAVTACIRRETFVIENGWYRLGNFLHTLGEYDKAEEMCNTLLRQTSDQNDLASIYHLLGMVKYSQKNYPNAIRAYKESIRIKKKILPPSDVRLASSYNNIGEVYNKTGDYSEALSYLEEALKIKLKTHPPNHPALALSYDNIGSALDNMSVYSQALLHYEKALDIRKRTLPQTHPDLSQSYHNIGAVFSHLEQYSKALSHFEKAIEIKQKILPPTHVSLATSYQSIAAVYERKEEYTRAQSFYEKAIDILVKSLPKNHPDVERLQKDLNRAAKNSRKFGSNEYGNKDHT